MTKYQEKLQDFYKMRDTLITEGYNDIESLKIYDKVELREITLEIIKEKGIILHWMKETTTVEQYNSGVYGTLLKPLTKGEYELLKEVLL